MRVVDVATEGMRIHAVFDPEGPSFDDEWLQTFFAVVETDDPRFRYPSIRYVVDRGVEVRTPRPYRYIVSDVEDNPVSFKPPLYPYEVAHVIDTEWHDNPLVLAVWVNRIPADPLVKFLFNQVRKVPGGFVMERQSRTAVRTEYSAPSFDDVTVYFLGVTVPRDRLPKHRSSIVKLNMHPDTAWWELWGAIDATRPLPTLRHVRLTLPPDGEWEPVRINGFKRWEGPAHVFRALLPHGLPVSATIARCESVVEAKPVRETEAT